MYSETVSDDGMRRQAKFKELDEDGSGELMLAELKDLLSNIEVCESNHAV